MSNMTVAKTLPESLPSYNCKSNQH